MTHFFCSFLDIVFVILKSLSLFKVAQIAKATEISKKRQPKAKKNLAQQLGENFSDIKKFIAKPNEAVESARTILIE